MDIKTAVARTVLPFGPALAQIRRDLGYSQEEFASLAGVSRGTISLWERSKGRPRAGTARLLVALLRALGEEEAQ